MFRNQTTDKHAVYSKSQRSGIAQQLHRILITLGGDSTQPSALNTLSNTAVFNINVTPEPITAFLLGIGLVFIALRASRQHKMEA